MRSSSLRFSLIFLQIFASRQKEEDLDKENHQEQSKRPKKNTLSLRRYRNPDRQAPLSAVEAISYQTNNFTQTTTMPSADINSINILEKFSLFNKQWTPHIIGELNGQYVKLCKLSGEFVWHQHENEDELFMVFKGTLLMDFRDGRTVEIKPGEILIVPRGVEHRPRTNGEEVYNLLFEPKATLHTGGVESELTAQEQPHI